MERILVVKKKFRCVVEVMNFLLNRKGTYIVGIGFRTSLFFFSSRCNFV